MSPWTVHRCTIHGGKVNICGYCSMNSAWTVTALLQNAWKKRTKTQLHKCRRSFSGIQTDTSIKKLKEKIFFSSLKYILGSIFVPRNLKFYTFIISSTLVKFQRFFFFFWWNDEMSNTLYFQLQKYNFLNWRDWNRTFTIF